MVRLRPNQHHRQERRGVKTGLSTKGDGGKQGAAFFGEVGHEGGAFGAFEEDFVAVSAGIAADLKGQGIFAADADRLDEKVVELGMSEGSTPDRGESSDSVKDGQFGHAKLHPLSVGGKGKVSEVKTKARDGGDGGHDGAALEEGFTLSKFANDFSVGSEELGGFAFVDHLDLGATVPEEAWDRHQEDCVEVAEQAATKERKGRLFERGVEGFVFVECEAIEADARKGSDLALDIDPMVMAECDIVLVVLQTLKQGEDMAISAKGGSDGISRAKGQDAKGWKAARQAVVALEVLECGHGLE